MARFTDGSSRGRLEVRLSARPSNSVTLLLSDPDLRDLVADALERNVIDTSGFKETVGVDIDHLAYDEVEASWRVTFLITSTERP